MKAIAEACVSLGQELQSQPELFGLIPFELEVCESAKRLANTGRITSRNEARAMAIAACKLAGLSDSETARRIGCSRNTIAPVIEQLESSGRIPGLQARLQCKLGRLAETAADELLTLIGSGDCWSAERSGAVRALGVTLGIATEKHLLVTGQSTAIIEQRAVSVTADQVRDWEEKLRQLFPVVELEPASSDKQSAAIPLIPNALGESATPLATLVPAPAIPNAPARGSIPTRPPARATLTGGEAAGMPPLGGGGGAAAPPQPSTMRPPE